MWAQGIRWVDSTNMRMQPKLVSPQDPHSPCGTCQLQITSVVAQLLIVVALVPLQLSAAVLRHAPPRLDRQNMHTVAQAMGPDSSSEPC